MPQNTHKKEVQMIWLWLPRVLSSTWDLPVATLNQVASHYSWQSLLHVSFKFGSIFFFFFFFFLNLSSKKSLYSCWSLWDCWRTFWFQSVFDLFFQKCWEWKTLQIRCDKHWPSLSKTHYATRGVDLHLNGKTFKYNCIFKKIPICCYFWNMPSFLYFFTIKCTF